MLKHTYRTIILASAVVAMGVFSSKSLTAQLSFLQWIQNALYGPQTIPTQTMLEDRPQDPVLDDALDLSFDDDDILLDEDALVLDSDRPLEVEPKSCFICVYQPITCDAAENAQGCRGDCEWNPDAPLVNGKRECRNRFMRRCKEKLAQAEYDFEDMIPGQDLRSAVFDRSCTVPNSMYIGHVAPASARQRSSKPRFA